MKHGHIFIGAILSLISIGALLGAGCAKNPPPPEEVTPPEETHTHDMVFHGQKNPACTAAGNYAYYYCSSCGKYFSDKEGADEITLESTVIDARGHKTGNLESDAQKDESGHWSECTNIGCFEKIGFEEHIYDDGEIVSQTQSVYTCTVCGFKDYRGAITANISGKINCDTDIDFERVILTLYNDEEMFEYIGEVDASGEYEIQSQLGSGYKLVAYSPEGVRGVSDTFDAVREGNPDTDITLTAGDVIGTVIVNGKEVKPICNVTPELLDDILDDNTVSTNITSDYASEVWPDRRRYLAPIATQVKKGDFAFDATLVSNLAYGYAGAGITDGSSVLLIETSTYQALEGGYVYARFGTFTDSGVNFKFNLAAYTGGIIAQESSNYKITPSIRRVGNSFDLYMGDVCFATLSAGGIVMKGDYRMLYSPSFLTRTYQGEIKDFVNAEEFTFLYSSEGGLAGRMTYSYNFGNYSKVCGKISIDPQFKDNLRDTRLVVKNGESCYTFAGISDADGNYEIDIPQGVYDFVFSNPASLYKAVNGVDVNEPSYNVGDIALESKNLNTSSVVINNNEITFGKDMGEYSDAAKMNLNDDAAKSIIYDNTVYNGEADFKGVINVNGGWGSPAVGITDGDHAVRVLLRNGYINQLELEYLTVTDKKDVVYVSGYRSYVLKSSKLPVYNNGNTSGDLNFIFRKKQNGGIEIYYGENLIVTISDTGFYLSEGISVDSRFTVGADGKISDPAQSGYRSVPDASFVSPDREFALYATVERHNAGAGGNVSFKAGVGTMHAEENTTDEKAEALKEVLEGKYISLLGDSITTFDGYSNVTTDNSTLATGIDKSCYPYYDVDRLEEIYWYKLINNTGMKLLVNNSIGGSRAYGGENEAFAACNFRCVNLHADTGEIAGKDPDIILVYIGINDVGATQETYEQFVEGYTKMITKIKNRYTNSDIFVIDLPHPDNDAAYPLERFNMFNEAINSIASEANLNIIHFRNSAADNGKTLTCDRLHPNVYGMEAYYQVIKDALYTHYCA